MIFLEKVKASSMRILPCREDGQAATLTCLLPELSSRQNKPKNRHITYTQAHAHTLVCETKIGGWRKGKGEGIEQIMCILNLP